MISTDDRQQARKEEPTKGARTVPVRGKVLQVCYIVESLDDAMNGWVKTIGAGPFFAQKNMHVETVYRGNPSWIDVSAAFGQAGEIQVEFIEVHGDNPSVYRDMYSPGQYGCHHVAMFVDDLDAAIEFYRANGNVVGMQGSFAGTPYAYIDTRTSTGLFTELFQNTNDINRLYKKIANAATDWNGREAIRPMALLFE
jgi:hypothetical protein